MNAKNKKIIVLILAMLLLLVACNKDKTSVNSAESQPEAAPVVSEASSLEDASQSDASPEISAAEGSALEDLPPIENGYSEEDIQKAVTGLVDRYVQQGSKNVDILAGVVFDSALVADVQVDTSAVDYETPGDYEVVYKVYILPEPMEGYLFGAYENVPAGDPLVGEVRRTVTVLTPDKAQVLADQDQPVLSDDGTILPKSDGTVPAIDPVKPESAESTQGTVVAAGTGETVSFPDNNDPQASVGEEPEDSAQASKSPAPSAGPESAAAPSPAAGAPDPSAPAATPKPSSAPTPAPATPKPSTAPAPSSAPQQPNTPAPSTPTPRPSTAPTPTPTPDATPTPHVHTWEHVDATGHYESVQTGTQSVQIGTIHHDAVTHEEAVWAYQYRCLACGAVFSTESAVCDHEAIACMASYTLDEWVDHYDTVVDSPAWDEPVYEDQPVYANVWVEDTPAYDRSTGCGATR